MMRVSTVSEMRERMGDDYNEYPEYIGAKRFYESDNDECPFLGVEYENGELWVYGVREEQQVDMDTLEKFLRMW